MSTREKLIACGLKELTRRGLHGFSLRAVGAAAGLSAMAVYRHFENKEALLQAVGEDAYAAFQQRMSRIPDGPMERWIREATHAYVAFALDDPGRFDACFVQKTKFEHVYPRDFRSGKAAVLLLIAQRVQAAQEQGRLQPGDPLEIALVLWAQVHGLVMLHRAGRFSLGRAEFLALCDRGCEHLLRGLAGRPEKTPTPKKKTKRRKRS